MTDAPASQSAARQGSTPGPAPVRTPAERAERASTTSQDLPFILLLIGVLSFAGMVLPLSGSVLIARGGWPLLIAASSLINGLILGALALRARRLAIERAAREREIAKQNAIIALLLNDFDADHGDWLWESDHDGRLTYASARLAPALGTSLATVMGQSLDAILCANPRNRGWPDLAIAMAARQPVDGLLCTIASGDHQSWWRLTARPLLAETGACLGYRGIAHDASDEHRRDVDLTAAREAAAQAESRKAQYMRAVSHELRTPLNAIVGFAELLGSDQAANLPDHVRSEYLRIIVDSTHRLQSLIKNVLDISRAERGALQLAEQDVDVAELAEVTVKLCQAMAEEADVTVVAHLPDGVEIRVDVARVKEVLAALIAAAIASSPAGACVEVSIDRPAGSGLRFIVFHRGAGLAASPFTRAFAPFHLFEPDSAEAFGGAIAMARRVAHLHGGDLAVEDVAGGGTRASFSIAAARVLPRRKVAHLANA